MMLLSLLRPLLPFVIVLQNLSEVFQNDSAVLAMGSCQPIRRLSSTHTPITTRPGNLAMQYRLSNPWMEHRTDFPSSF